MAAVLLSCMTSAWINELFAAQSVANGGIVRRARKNVDDDMLEELIHEAGARGYHVIETGEQVVVLCHAGQLVMHC